MKQTLKWLRITDEDGLLSITNLAILIVLVRLMVLPQLSITDALTVVVVLTSYNFKKHLNKNQEEKRKELDLRIDDLASQINTLALKSGLK